MLNKLSALRSSLCTHPGCPVLVLLPDIVHMVVYTGVLVCWPSDNTDTSIVSFGFCPISATCSSSCYRSPASGNTMPLHSLKLCSAVGVTALPLTVPLE